MPTLIDSFDRLFAGRTIARGHQLILILSAVAALASVASHAAVYMLGIRSKHGGNHHYGSVDLKALTILHGSSLAYSGLDWNKLAAHFGGAIESWATAGSSPAEWELQHRRSPDITNTVIVLSPYDMNEYSLCDMRADIVPISTAVKDLWTSNADWVFSKRILSQYPIMLLRKLFPTVGRSDGVMTGIRDFLTGMISAGNGDSSHEGFAFGPTGMTENKEKLSDWSPARLQRRLVQQRVACQNRHTFNGPKSAALARLVKRAREQGPVTFLVVPVSPTYQREFLSAQVNTQFEEALSVLRHLAPDAPMIRLDHNKALHDDALFSDFVHMNLYGQLIATDSFLTQIGAPRP